MEFRDLFFVYELLSDIFRNVKRTLGQKGEMLKKLETGLRTKSPLIQIKLSLHVHVNTWPLSSYKLVVRCKCSTLKKERLCKDVQAAHRATGSEPKGVVQENQFGVGLTPL